MENFREHAATHGFIRIVNSAVPLDMSKRNRSITDAVRLGYCDGDLENGKNARWALRAASSNPN